MTDETENVDAGSETSGEQAAETSQETTAAETTETSTETSAETSADAGGAAETTETSEVTEDASRTGYADKGLRAGDACVCPDGRKGTVHQYDAGLICIPNQDQG
jgi:hypothetical protein